MFSISSIHKQNLILFFISVLTTLACSGSLEGHRARGGKTLWDRSPGVFGELVIMTSC